MGEERVFHGGEVAARRESGALSWVGGWGGGGVPEVVRDDVCGGEGCKDRGGSAHAQGGVALAAVEAPGLEGVCDGVGGGFALLEAGGVEEQHPRHLAESLRSTG